MQDISSIPWVDLIILLIILVSLVIGFMRGAVKTVISILSWVTAFYISLYFADTFSSYLQSYVSSPEIRIWLTRATTFVTIIIIGSIIGNILNYLVGTLGLKMVDRLTGVFLGIVFGIFIVSCLVLVSGYLDILSKAIIQKSSLVPYFYSIVDWLKTFLPFAIIDSIIIPNINEKVI